MGSEPCTWNLPTMFTVTVTGHPADEAKYHTGKNKNNFIFEVENQAKVWSQSGSRVRIFSVVRKHSTISLHNTLIGNLKSFLDSNTEVKYAEMRDISKCEFLKV